MGFFNCSMFCCALLCVYSSFEIISMGKRELVPLLCLFSWWLVIVVWLFLTMPRVCLQFVIVVFPDHSHLLFLKRFISTVMGAAILIWKSLDQFLKIAIHRGISVCEAQFWCILINSNTNNTPDKYFSISIYIHPA